MAIMAFDLQPDTDAAATGGDLIDRLRDALDAAGTACYEHAEGDNPDKLDEIDGSLRERVVELLRVVLGREPDADELSRAIPDFD